MTNGLLTSDEIQEYINLGRAFGVKICLEMDDQELDDWIGVLHIILGANPIDDVEIVDAKSHSIYTKLPTPLRLLAERESKNPETQLSHYCQAIGIWQVLKIYRWNAESG